MMQNPSVICFLRKSEEEELLFVFNFTPIGRYGYQVGAFLNPDFIKS